MDRDRRRRGQEQPTDRWMGKGTPPPGIDDGHMREGPHGHDYGMDGDFEPLEIRDPADEEDGRPGEYYGDGTRDSGRTRRESRSPGRAADESHRRHGDGADRRHRGGVINGKGPAQRGRRGGRPLPPPDRWTGGEGVEFDDR